MSKTPSERQFYSESGEDVRVTLPGGAVAIVGRKPRTLPQQFHRAALKAGCLIKGAAPAPTVQEKPEDDPHERIKLIKAAILTAVEAEPDEGADEAAHNEYEAKYGDAFTQDGTPSVRWIEKELGFNISAQERDQAWNEVKAENGLDDEDEDDDGESVE